MGEVFDFGLNGIDLNQIVGNAMHLPQALQLAKQGRIDEAAAIYSQITGMEHADAVESVKAMAAGHAVSLTPGRSGTTWQTVETNYSQPAAQVTTRPPMTFSSSSVSMAPSATSRKASGGRSCGLLVGIIVAVAALILVLVGGGVFFFAKGTFIGPIGFASPALSFGSEGIGQGQFEDARSVGADANGNITVADYQDGRVQTFDAAGKFVSGFNISSNGKKVYVTGLTVDRNGNIYGVHDGKIFVFDDKGSVLDTLGDFDHRYDDVTIGGDGKLYAIENDETIVRFKPDRSVDLEVPDTFTNVTGDLELDSHVAADGLGNMYVVGSFHYLVLKFSPDGKFLNRFGGEAQSTTGNEPGKFSTPRAIVVDGYGRVYISDFFDVKVFDSDGAYLNKIDINGGPFGLAVDGQNFLYVVTTNKNVVKYAVQKPAE
jgi:sugar lactone lactonase YvrE